MATENFGTRISWEIISHPNLVDVYGVTLPRKDSSKKSILVQYRIAPENFSRPEKGWRLDESAMMGWEAVTPNVFKTPGAAAKEFAKMLPMLSVTDRYREELEWQDGLSPLRDLVKKATDFYPDWVESLLLQSLFQARKGWEIPMDWRQDMVRALDGLASPFRGATPGVRDTLHRRNPKSEIIIERASNFGIQVQAQWEAASRDPQGLVKAIPGMLKLIELIRKTLAPLKQSMQAREV